MNRDLILIVVFALKKQCLRQPSNSALIILLKPIYLVQHFVSLILKKRKKNVKKL